MVELSFYAYCDDVAVTKIISMFEKLQPLQ